MEAQAQSRQAREVADARQSLGSPSMPQAPSLRHPSLLRPSLLLPSPGLHLDLPRQALRVGGVHLQVTYAISFVTPECYQHFMRSGSNLGALGPASPP